MLPRMDSRCVRFFHHCLCLKGHREGIQSGYSLSHRNTGTIQTTLAASLGNNYGLALAVTAGIVAIAVAGVTALGPEARGVTFGDR
jgi:hypothetical protein